MFLIASLVFAMSSLQEPRAQVSDALDGLHLAAALADGETYFGSFTEDAIFLGTDANERWTIDEFRAYAEPYFAEGHGWTYLPTERNIRFSPSGDVAWFDERLQNGKYGEVRGTGVLELVGEEWKVAQYNLAFPLPNDLAEGVIKKSTRSLRVGEPAAKEFIIKDGERSLFVWNKVVPSQLELEAQERPVVILLPSASFSARALWDLPLRDYSVMNAMAERGFDVFAVELGGFGLSSAPTDNPAGGCESGVRDLQIAIDAIRQLRDVEQVLLVGLSWGSQVAARYAAEQPQRVRGLVLYGHRWQSRFPESSVSQIYGNEVFEEPTRAIDADVARGDFVEGQFEEDVPEAFTQFLLSQGRQVPTGPIRDYVHELPVCQPAQLTMPTLMLYGRSEFVPPPDVVLPSGDSGIRAVVEAHRAEQRDFFSQLPGAKHWIEVPGAGHSAHLDEPHLLVQGCLIGWMSRL